MRILFVWDKTPRHKVAGSISFERIQFFHIQAPGGPAIRPLTTNNLFPSKLLDPIN